MLKIYPAVTVTQVPGQYTERTGQTTSHILFPDTEDKDRYYALPEYPAFLGDDKGNPNFNLTWFYGSGYESGGVCTFTVALPIPDLALAGVKKRILEALGADAETLKRADNMLLLCQASAAGDAAKVAALKKDVGLAADVDASNIPFDKTRGRDQFLPLESSLKLSPIPFKSGKVTVTAFQDQNAYNNWNATNDPGKPVFTGTFETTPSLINSNAAVVTFSLKDLGANLFWHALGGPEFDSKGVQGYDKVAGGMSIIAVRYTAEFDGQLPGATATVMLKKSVVAKVITGTETMHGAWGTTWSRDIVVGKDYKEAIDQSITIDLPVKDDAISKILTEWAAKQLEDMVKAQLPEVKLSDLNDSNMQQISVLKDETRKYVLNQGMAVTKSPQGQLPKVSELVKTADLGKFFNTINLNDVPYFNMDVTVNPPDQARLAKMNVGRLVITQLTFDGQKLREKTSDSKAGSEVSTLEFNALPHGDRKDQLAQRLLLGTFDRRQSGKGVIKYSYLVSYTDGTPSFTVDNVTLDPQQCYVDLSAKDLGVLTTTLNGSDLPWGLLSSAKIELKYADWEGTETLTADKLVSLVVRPLGRKIDQKLQYRLTLNCTSGAPFVGDWKEVTPGPTTTLRLSNPIGDAICTINFVLGSGVTKAQIRVKYMMPAASGPARAFETMLVLQSAGPQQKAWSVPQVTGGSFVVTKAKVDGKDLVSEEQKVDSSAYEVTLNKDLIDIF